MCISWWSHSSSMGFSRQEYWSGWPCPPPGDLPKPRIEPTVPCSLCGPCITGGSFTTGPSGKLLLSIVTAPNFNPTNHQFTTNHTQRFFSLLHRNICLFDNCHCNRCDVVLISLSLMTNDVDWASSCNHDHSYIFSGKMSIQLLAHL